MQVLKDFINNRPALKISSLEKLIDCPASTLYQWLKYDKGLASKWLWLLVIELCEYGLHINGYSFSYHDDMDIFVIEKPFDIDDYSEPRAYLFENENGSYFKHTIDVERMIISDSSELLSFLNV